MEIINNREVRVRDLVELKSDRFGMEILHGRNTCNDYSF